MNKFNFDIAFSFLAKDEEVALKLYETLKTRVDCFIYSEEQKRLAGRDGEEVFNRVFSKEARIVVVLYRSDWGKTPWTKIEETAIRNRGFEEGYDFVSFIPLEKAASLPNWLPKNRIWIGLERWGIEGAATALESRVQESFGEIKELTIADKAQIIKNNQEIRIKKKNYLRSSQAFQDANNEVQKILTELKKFKEQLTDDTTGSFFNERSEHPNHHYEIFYKGLIIQFVWLHVNSNTIDSNLLIKLFKAKGHRGINYQEINIETNKLRFDRDFNERIGWSDFSINKDFKTTKQLQEYWMTRFLFEVDNLNATQ